MLWVLPLLMSTDTERDLSEQSADLRAGGETAMLVLVAASFAHLLNDTIQSLIPAIYPVLKDSFQLSFAQIGLITMTFQVTASLLQPLVGLYTDRRPQPFSLPSGTNRMGPLPPHEPCLLEVFLPREHEKLFHLLSDGKISASRAAGITVSIFVSVLSRCWNHHRRADW